ncbi:hypothetical protein [Novosphingobium malaysiense]|uniref:hypothetical protein n=1 Tax=Novosphingobium malaysiense TaxID=1348853 RepID=UPI000ABB0B72|nr:hypothetical protein [Novosphingobium malaysiense]
MEYASVQFGQEAILRPHIRAQQLEDVTSCYNVPQLSGLFCAKNISHLMTRLSIESSKGKEGLASVTPTSP